MIIGQHELQWILSAEQQDVCETQMPLSTQSPNYRAIFKISHDPCQNFRAGAFVKKKIYTRNGSWWACIILIARSMGTIGKYIDTKIALNKKQTKNLLEDACKLYASGCRESESVSVNQKPGRSSLYTEQHEKHTHDFNQACRVFSFCKFSLKSKQQLNRSKWTNEKQVWPPLMTHSPE